jgi:hypothetical protein
MNIETVQLIDKYMELFNANKINGLELAELLLKLNKGGE